LAEQGFDSPRLHPLIIRGNHGARLFAFGYTRQLERSYFKLMKVPILTKSLLLTGLMITLMISACATRQQPDPTDAAAQVKLGNRYAYGTWVPKDPEEAARWYRKAALQGDAEGQMQLGLCYATGTGVPMNDIEAARWYRRGALQGNTEAQYRLGVCYKMHDGVPKDLITAYMWLNLAAAADHESARAIRNAVAHQMTNEQITKAQQMSVHWKPDCP